MARDGVKYNRYSKQNASMKKSIQESIFKIFSFKDNFFFFLFYEHWLVFCLHVSVLRVLEPLELELQTAISCHVSARN